MTWSLQELHERMTAVELREWWIYYQMEPFGDARADLRMAISTASLVTMWTKSSAKVTIADFLPDFYAEYHVRHHGPETSHDTQRAFTLMTSLIGGKIIRNGDATNASA